ncbi:MAG: ATP-binding cassette domain-containing protein [Proteobacteria bacterium]|nr:ATP-binding cassette domain-containing protein [Pseudomonadota bacterium]
MLTATNLSKNYQGHKVLKGVSLSLKPGEITTVLGPSGSGKTTLLKLLSLLEAADAGSLMVDEKIYNFPWDDRGGAYPLVGPWPKLTVVFQQLFLWPHLTLRENILLPVLARGATEASVKKDLAELVDIMEMGEFLDRYPNQVSGGQKQRAALARAILLKPQYLLLDEITSALDVIQVAKIVELLPLLAKRGIGMVLVTHLLNFARKTADNVLYMENGAVVEEGARSILAKPKSKQLRAFLQAADKAS